MGTDELLELLEQGRGWLPARGTLPVKLLEPGEPRLALGYLVHRHWNNEGKVVRGPLLLSFGDGPLVAELPPIRGQAAPGQHGHEAGSILDIALDSLPPGVASGQLLAIEPDVDAGLL
jgi:hypothetical protein